MYGNMSSVVYNPGPLGPSMVEACNATAFFTFMALLDTYLRANEKISGVHERVKPVEILDDTYDFIVIGSGASGAVMARRLSEITEWKVLLLEAGPDEAIAAQVPSFCATLLSTDITWKYQTTNESYSCLAANGSCSMRYGRCLGGNTALNSMIYVRGTPADFNKWADLGNEGWSWEDVMPYFLRSEDNGEIDRVGRIYHSTDGPLSVERFPYIDEIGHSLINAGVEKGYGSTEDLNGDTIVGGTVAQTTNKKGVRKSTAAAFLRPIRDQKNLHISLNSMVTKIVIEDGKAVGVEYYKNGEFKRVNARREVIASAGAIRSPQLLLLSGIGPKVHLEDVGVEVVHDLPGVGENLHDHVLYYMPHTVNEPDAYINDWAAAVEYLAFQTGPLSTSGLNPATFRLSSSLTTPDDPDFQIVFFGKDAGCAPGSVDALQTSGLRSISVVSVLLQPKSRGRISLASNDPLEYPTIWLNFLEQSTDRDVMVEGIELALALADTDSMRAYNLTLSMSPDKACSDHAFGSKDYWDCAIQQNTGPGHHTVGSCKMGPSTDSMAVVNNRLQVYGLEGLRVADASIMPLVTSASTVATTIMIGEYAAEMIKEDWKPFVA